MYLPFCRPTIADEVIGVWRIVYDVAVEGRGFGRLTLSSWLVNTLVTLTKELEAAIGEREVWAALFSLLPAAQIIGRKWTD